MAISIVWEGFGPRGEKTLYSKFTKVVMKACLDEFGMPSADVNVLYCGEEEIRTLNRNFRNIDKATDVLSFPFEEIAPLEGFVGHLGDLAICPEYCARHAQKVKKSFRDEIALMLVHGFLHLMGYDHDTTVNTRVMNKRTKEILTALELPELPEPSR